MALSEMELDLRSMKRLFGEVVLGGTRPTKGLSCKEDLVFFQLKMVKEPSGLTRGLFVGINLIEDDDGRRAGCCKTAE